MPVLQLMIAASLAAPAPAAMPELPKALSAVLRDYRAAMEARSIEKLAAVFDADLFLFEGTHKNVGWADYRDNHIGPEMKEWSAFEVLDARVVDALLGDDLTYVATESVYRIVSQGKTVDIAAAESFVLVRRGAAWKIRHLHYSGKKIDRAAH